MSAAKFTANGNSNFDRITARGSKYKYLRRIGSLSTFVPFGEGFDCVKGSSDIRFAASFASEVDTSQIQGTTSSPLQIAESEIDPLSRRTTLMIHPAISSANSSDSYSLGIESSNPIRITHGFNTVMTYTLALM